MVTKNKTRMFNGKKYTIALIADNKSRAEIRAKKIRAGGGSARITTQKREGGFHANRYYVWKRG